MTEAEFASETKAHVDYRVAWLSLVGFWVFYYVINTARMAVEDEPDQWHKLGLRAGVTLCGFGLSSLLYLLLRRIEHRSLPTLITVSILAAIPLSAAYASTNFVAFYVISPSEMDIQEIAHKRHEPAEIITETALTWYFFVVAWATLYIALAYAAKVGLAERRSAQYRAEAQAAQLRALQYQISPHFLFNTLNSLSTLVLQARNEEAEQMIMNLSTFFRSSLVTEMNEDLSLHEEIRMQQLYLDIEQIRFPERLRVRIDISPEVEEATIPAMLLQPVVENAIKHGVARSSAPVTVTITAFRKGSDLLRIVVQDDAPLADSQEKRDMSGSGVGLRNVCARLDGRYGDTASCHYGPCADGGFHVTLTFPLTKHG